MPCPTSTTSSSPCTSRIRRTAGTSRARVRVQRLPARGRGRRRVGEGRPDAVGEVVEPAGGPLVLAQLLDDPDVPVGEQLGGLLGLRLGRAEPRGAAPAAAPTRAAPRRRRTRRGRGPTRWPAVSGSTSGRPWRTRKRVMTGTPGRRAVGCGGPRRPARSPGVRRSVPATAASARVVPRRAVRVQAVAAATRRPSSSRLMASAPADVEHPGRRRVPASSTRAAARSSTWTGQRRSSSKSAPSAPPARACTSRSCGERPSPRISEVRATTASGQTASTAVSAAALAAPYARDGVGRRGLGVHPVLAGEDDVAGDEHRPDRRAGRRRRRGGRCRWR